MNKPHAVRPADQKVLMAFMSQLILCKYATGTIGKFLSCIVTKHRQFGYPSPLVYREMGSWLMDLKKNMSSGVKTKMRWTPIHIQLIASLPTTSLLHEHNRSSYSWAPWAHFGNPSGGIGKGGSAKGVEVPSKRSRKATHISRTKATTVRIPKVTRTRHVAIRQEDSVSITCIASRKWSDFDCVVACKDFVRYQQEWTNGYTKPDSRRVSMTRNRTLSPHNIGTEPFLRRARADSQR